MITGPQPALNRYLENLEKRSSFGAALSYWTIMLRHNRVRVRH